ncbi:hypothetical protein LguiB_025428 [Lonicera macranthoides]
MMNSSKMDENTIGSINSSNIGFQAPENREWINEDTEKIKGRVEPIQTYLKKNKAGLGTDEVSDGTADNVINPIRCEVCKIDCNSRDVLEKHMLGKKHKRNVQMQQMVPPAIFPSPLETILNESLGQTISGASGMIVGEELEAKKRKMLEGGASADSMMFCTICNVACNSQAVFIMHLSGRKHTAQVLEKSSSTTNGNPDYAAPVVEPVENRETSEGEVVNIHEPKRKAPESQTPQEDIETKKRKIVEGGAAESDIRVCTLCKVVCNSPEVFKFHLGGQKHAAMVKKQAEAERNAATAQAALLVKERLYRKENLGG